MGREYKDPEVAIHQSGVSFNIVPSVNEAGSEPMAMIEVMSRKKKELYSPTDI